MEQRVYQRDSTNRLVSFDILVEALFVGSPVAEIIEEPFDYDFTWLDELLEEEEVFSEEESLEAVALPIMSMRAHMHPARVTPRGAIVIPADDANAGNAFTLKPGVRNGIPSFYGKSNENPYRHIRLFEEFIRQVSHETQYEMACLKLFPSSLQDGAYNWYESLKEQSLET